MSNVKKEAGAASNGKGISKTQSTTKTTKIDTAEALAEKIKFYTAKRELIQNRLLLQNKLDEVQAIEFKDPKSLEELGQGETRLVLYKGYNNEVLKINNAAFISDFKEFFAGKCAERIAELDNEILM